MCWMRPRSGNGHRPTGCLQWSTVPQKQRAEVPYTAASAARSQGQLCCAHCLVPSACWILIKICLAECTQRCTSHGTLAQKAAAFASFKQRCRRRTRAAGYASAPSACMQQMPAPCLSCCGWQPSWTAYALQSAMHSCMLHAACKFHGASTAGCRPSLERSAHVLQGRRNLVSVLRRATGGAQGQGDDRRT